LAIFCGQHSLGPIQAHFSETYFLCPNFFMPQSTINSDQSPPAGLVGINPCLEKVFTDPATRISVRLFHRLKAERLIPYYKIGGRILFDPIQVRYAIDKHFGRKAK